MTIRENLLWGNPEATDEELIEACKAAQAHEFVMAFPDGYETNLGQGGVNVSGGQKAAAVHCARPAEESENSDSG